MHRIWNGRLGLGGLVLALGLIAAACGGGANAAGGGSGGLRVMIGSPASGSAVSEPFTVKLDASAPIGDPTTGDHHVHLCFDGGSCDELAQSVIAYSNTVQVDGLSPGTHTIEASLRNADHSDAGPSDTITVIVAGAGSSTSGTTGGSTAGTSDSGSSGRGY